MPAASYHHEVLRDSVLSDNSRLCSRGKHTQAASKSALAWSCAIATSAFNRRVTLQVITPFNVYFNAYLIFKKWEMWRLLTNFFFFGNLGKCYTNCLPAWPALQYTHTGRGLTRQPEQYAITAHTTVSDIHTCIRTSLSQNSVCPVGLDFVFHMFFLVKYCKSLEEGSFRGRSADFLWMLVFGGSLLTVLAPFVNIEFLGSSLTFMMVYVWGRRHQYVNLSFLGIFNFTAPYLPWVLLAFSVMLGSSPKVDLLGMVAGQYCSSSRLCVGCLQMTSSNLVTAVKSSWAATYQH